MSAIRSEERTSYEKAVYHIERSDVKEIFFGSSANEARTVISASNSGSEKTLAELAASRECIKRCMREKRSRKSSDDFFSRARFQVAERRARVPPRHGELGILILMKTGAVGPPYT